MSHSEPIAHLSDDGRIQPLRDHLIGTAERAEDGRRVRLRGWGKLAGLWHDLDKYSEDFQRMIRTAGALATEAEHAGRVDHSTSGSILSINRFGPRGRIIAYVISGHHAGLPGWQSETSGLKRLAKPLQKDDLFQKVVLAWIAAEITNPATPLEKPKLGSLLCGLGMLFSRRRRHSPSALAHVIKSDC